MPTLLAIVFVACALAPSGADAQIGAATGAQAAGAPPAHAPTAQAAPAEPTATSSADQPLVGPGLVLSEDALKARLDTVKNASAMGPGARAKAVSSYETALADLTTAGSFARKAAAFEEARTEAPRMLSDLEHEAEAQLPKTKINRQLSATELEALLHELEDQLGAARTILAKIEGEQNKRARRRVESPRQVGDASQEVADLETRLRVAPIPAPNDEVALAERAAMLARREMLLATLAFNEKEIESYDARRELLAAKRDQAIRRIARLTETVHELRDLVGNAQRTEAQRDADKAVETARELAKQHPALRAIAQRNAELAAMRTGPEGLATRIEETRATLADTTADLQRVTERYDRAHEKAEAVGFTPAIGLLLRKEGAELPDLAERQRMLRERHGEIGNVQLRLIELEDERDEIADVDVALQRVVSKVADARLEPREQRRLQSTARELLLTYRGYLDSLIDDYDAYFTTLVELDAKEQDLITAVRRYRNYIDENVLWIRGPSVASARMFDGARGALAWLVRPRNAARLVDGLATTLVVRPLTTALAVLCWVVLFVYRRRMQVLHDELCPAHASAFGLTFADTLRAIVLTAALAAIWPGFIALLAYLVSTVEGASGEFGAALGSGLRTTAGAFFVAEFLRRLCKTRGVGEVHLGWSAKVAAPVRRAVASAMLFGLPAVFVVSLFDAQSNDLFKSSLGRVVFLLGMIGLAALTYRLLRPGAGVLEYDRRAAAAWRGYVSRFTHLAVTAAPLILVAMATAGYDFAALSVTRRAAVTLAVALALFLIHSVILRWLALARRRMVVRQARQVEAARQQVEKAAKSDGEPVPVAEADTVDIGAVNAQTRRLVTTFSAAAMLIAAWLIWHDVMPALRVFEHVELWNVTQQTVETLRTDEGEQQRTLTQQRPVTLADLLAAVVIALLAMAAGRNIPGLLEITVLQQLSVDTGLRYAITSISRYVIAIIGTVLVVSELGVSWSKVQWLIAAMTVGLGFGLQEIFANFVSGLIILFERPIRVGDVVTLGQVSGAVSRIRIRATTIVDWDRKELIVPNKEFITGQLINWTLSDQILRVVIPVGIAYGSDTELAERLLLRIAQSSEHVLADPPPSVLFAEFGDNALNFQLRVFTANLDHAHRARHQLAMAIDKEFRNAKIEIAFPQRDLHIRSVETPIPVAIRAEENRNTQANSSDPPSGVSTQLKTGA